MTKTDHHNRDADAPDFMAARDPFALFEAWFAEAATRELNDPNAMALATVDSSGMPNVRMVLLKGLDTSAHGADRGFVFYTNYEGTKGRELLASGKAAVVFHWKSLRRQVRVRGPVTKVNAAEADAYYQSRPRGSRIGAWASDQSRPLASREKLETRVAELDATYTGRDIPRPAHWGGFRITPLEIEFWHDRPFRLHDRLVFRRLTPVASWTTTQLYP